MTSELSASESLKAVTVTPRLPHSGPRLFPELVARLQPSPQFMAVEPSAGLRVAPTRLIGNTSLIADRAPARRRDEVFVSHNPP